MLTCKDASHLISARQERRLDFWERWGLRLHVWMCISCRRFEGQVALMRQALRMLGKRAEAEAEREGDSTAFPPEARERIRQALAKRGMRE